MKQRHLFGEKKPESFWSAVFSLVGHMAGTAVIFVSLILFGWVISVIMHTLDATHNFPPEILAAFSKFELYLTYFDMVLCSLFLLFGAVRFAKDLGEIL